ncbi:non-canonical purine NTP pyrophosphatase [Oecophyllibacter saccharovorans]|uniref:non-canonical purine NTP pyrophosphatase n=1 Tax=Oecophyllibacter saccharovorans TaxID=2558360 RepID=UPI001167F14A|nr:non-canonical purine NTP pyrophosphatase [Oecophyllibacter saccharovorans]TPW35143.1 non-canonical purine NTP pyrophosphatase [Oecophyllibacter saccharovorans]
MSRTQTPADGNTPAESRRCLQRGAEIVLASHNAGKIREFSLLLAPLGIKIRSAAELNLPEPEETADSFEGNAEIKALAAARATGLPALADDSGFCVAALEGRPGVYSARWAGPERDMNVAMKRVHDEMVQSGSADRGASFVAVLCLAWPDGQTRSVRGTCEGEVCWPPRGTGGHGYDPIFVPAVEIAASAGAASPEPRSFGQMSDEEKNRCSHRGRAMKRFVAECVAPPET